MTSKGIFHACPEIFSLLRCKKGLYAKPANRLNKEQHRTVPPKDGSGSEPVCAFSNQWQRSRPM
jgi:hypothetical protein